jgi:hypothetical protein
VCPVTPPPVPPPPPAPDYSVPADIPDNFPTANAMESSGLGVPAKSGDDVGAFRIVCPAQLPALGVTANVRRDDPLTAPGLPGKAPHLHTFGVNTKTNASSTYQSLRTSGGGCGAPEASAAYRSAFWFPSMLDGAGNVVLPDYFNTYYKQLPKTHPDCLKRSAGCVPLPNGLRFIEGWNPVTGTGGPGGYFECWVDDNTGAYVPGTTRSSSIAALVAQGCAKNVTNGKYPLLIFQTTGPECWDGKNVDSADHRSHIGHANRSTTGTIATSANSNYGCPPGWFLIPLISIREVFTTDANFAAGKWRWDCDMPGMVAGSCGHFDYWEAWSPVVKAKWQKNCIDGHLSCNGGELGDGTQIKGLVRYPLNWVRHQLVPVPPAS